MKLAMFSAIVTLATGPLWAGLSVVVPETVLPAEKVNTILSERNMYFRHELSAGEGWDKSERQYASHLLGKRTQYLSLAEVKRRTLQDGFATRLKVQQLIRAALDPHVALGQILPGINVTVGDGAAPISTANAFTGLFGLLFPQNWMNLAAQNKAKKVMQYLFVKNALDEVNNAELAYIDQHQAIMDFEIRNFYLVHGLITARYFEQNYLKAAEQGFETSEEAQRILDTFKAMVGNIGSEMSLNRGKIKFGFDTLALIMALEKDASGALGVDTINIYNIADFPTLVRQLSDLPDPLKSKSAFLQEAVSKSIELRAIQELYEISKLNVGITAFSVVTSNRENSATREPRFGLSFGYGTIPKILQAKSGAKTAQINVEQEYIKFLDTARRAHDTYTNNLGLYTETVRSLEFNKQAFLSNLSHVIDQDNKIDFAFQEAIHQRVEAELQMNLALHTSLKGLAIMRRLLLGDEEEVLRYLPEGREIEKAFALLQKDDLGGANPYDNESKIRRVRKTKDLVEILNSQDQASVRKLVQENLSYLMHSKTGFIKSKRFYQVLENYIQAESIALSAEQTKDLHHKKHRL